MSLGTRLNDQWSFSPGVDRGKSVGEKGGSDKLNEGSV